MTKRQLSHHYFEIDTDVVFKTLQEDIPILKDVVIRMFENVKNDVDK